MGNNYTSVNVFDVDENYIQFLKNIINPTDVLPERYGKALEFIDNEFYKKFGKHLDNYPSFLSNKLVEVRTDNIYSFTGEHIQLETLKSYIRKTFKNDSHIVLAFGISDSDTFGLYMYKQGKFVSEYCYLAEGNDNSFLKNKSKNMNELYKTFDIKKDEFLSVFQDDLLEAVIKISDLFKIPMLNDDF